MYVQATKGSFEPTESWDQGTGVMCVGQSYAMGDVTVSPGRESRTQGKSRQCGSSLRFGNPAVGPGKLDLAAGQVHVVAQSVMQQLCSFVWQLLTSVLESSSAWTSGQS